VWPPGRDHAAPRAAKSSARLAVVLAGLALAVACATTGPSFRPAGAGEVELAEDAWNTITKGWATPVSTVRMLYDATYRDGDLQRSATAAVTLDERGMRISLSGPFGIGLGRAQWRDGSVTVSDRKGEHTRTLPEDSPEFGQIFGVPLSVREFVRILCGRPTAWPAAQGEYEIAGGDLARAHFDAAGRAEEFTFHLRPPALVSWRLEAGSSVLSVSYGRFDHGIPARLSIEDLKTGRKVTLVRTAYETAGGASAR
jgi:hypothetical protein